MSTYRPAAIANAFYPGTSDAINAELSQYLTLQGNNTLPKALIVPHAGWRYSGRCAGMAYSKYYGKGEHIKRVILIGPAHKIGFQGLATTSADYWSSPLGAYKIEQDSLTKLCEQQPYINAIDQAHANEHCLEVQLPFIMKCFPNAQLMPFLASQGGLELARQFLDVFWGSEETIIIISSDLSHYTAPEICRSFDDETANFVENYQYSQLDGKRACGYQGISALLALKEEKKLQIERINLCHSGDAIPSDKVVGYGSWAIYC